LKKCRESLPSRQLLPKSTNKACRYLEAMPVNRLGRFIRCYGDFVFPGGTRARCHPETDQPGLFFSWSANSGHLLRHGRYGQGVASHGTRCEVVKITLKALHSSPRGCPHQAEGRRGQLRGGKQQRLRPQIAHRIRGSFSFQLLLGTPPQVASTTKTG